MERVFLDSSALVKFYVDEPGSEVVERLITGTEGESVYLAMITGAEVVAALNRAERTGSLTKQQGEDATQHFN